MTEPVITDLQYKQQQAERARSEAAHKRISNLGKVEQFLAKISEEAATFKTQAEPKHFLQRLLRKVRNVRTTKGLPSGANKPLMRVQNELTSLYEGARTNSLTAKDFYIDEPRRQLEVIRELRLSAISRTSLEAQNISAKDFAVESSYEAFGTAIAQAAKPERSLVEAALKRTGYLVGRFSVVPIMSSTTRFIYDLAAQERLPARNLAGYVALDRQLVLGVPLGADIEDYEEQIQALESSAGTSLDFACEEPYAYAGASWYWLATASDLAKKARCCPNGFVVQSWGFL